jgi:hypothetical protein
MHKAFQTVRAVLDDARLAYKRYYDGRIPGHAKESEFAVGDEVKLYSPRLRSADARSDVGNYNLSGTVLSRSYNIKYR